ncbi:MAG: rhodanese-like domain-containing protein [Actinomycetota bacterium]|nr:rhodanese-like domain-containing protein [Actinomycetota bacterium]
MNEKKYFLSMLIISISLISVVLYGCINKDIKTEQEINISEQIVIDDLDGEKEEIEIIAEDVAEVIPISVEKAYEIISSSGDYVVLDVRSQQEYSEEHIQDAILIPVSELEGRLDELPVNKPIITYCRIGGRSTSAADILVKNGFTPVYNMLGGIEEWISERYPTVEGNQPDN